MNFEVEISYKANLDIRHIYEYYVMNNFDLKLCETLNKRNLFHSLNI